MLGPLAATSGTQPIKLGGKRQRIVLALLLANANRPVSQETLVDAVWSGQPPESGTRTLHSYISTLRKILGGVITRQAEGYLLTVKPEQVDAFRFRALVDEANPLVDAQCELASELLREALGLWRGPPYGDLGYEEALIADAAQLNEERIAAQEMRFEADLACGRHEALIPEIEALSLENPYRERLVGQLMISLYRSGRQAEALNAINRLRDRLTTELGIDPSLDLQDLELKILEQAPTLASSGYMGGARPAARGYELHEPTGDSIFGTRYRSFQSAIGREVGVLVIDEEIANSSRFIRSFQPEMQIVSAFEHPHLTPVFDYWRDPTQACVVGPHYQGGNLVLNQAQQAWSMLDVVRVGVQVASALGYLHRNDYPHGNIDAGAVYLDEEGNAYLAETGLSRLLPGSTASTVASDIFQLGQLVFDLLALGRPSGESLEELRPDLPRELGYAIGRAIHPDPKSRFRRVDDFARALRQSVGLDVGPVPSRGPAMTRQRNPYKGLRAFQETDAADFHGRRSLIQEMIGVLGNGRLLTVVGPSGSGKSSVVRAGLLPEIRNGALPGSEAWAITDMFPGTHPFEELESALLRVAVRRPLDLHQILANNPQGLLKALPEMTASEDQVLIVIDQFEELFSLVSSTDERRRFLEMLAIAATHPDSSARLVLTLRADFFDQPLEYPDFADVMRNNLVTVSPPSAEGLAAAIAQPALDAGIAVEPGLVPRIVEDVQQEPGGLPLLQYAMTELFESRDGDVLTMDAYDRLGGVGGALANRAEELYVGLTPEGRAVAQQMFLRLVTVDDHADDTRRRIRQSEVTGLGFDRSVVHSVLERFGSFRLLSFDRDVVSRTPTVELAHEALLSEWARLHGWIEERRGDLVIHRRLQMTAQEWEDSGHDPSYLMRGSRLDQALDLIENTDLSVSQDEKALIEASAAQLELETVEREALEAKSARRRKFAMGVLAGAAIISSILGLYAVAQRGDALDNAALATARELSLVSRELADDDPELGILLALEGISELEAMGLSPPPETLSALWHSYTQQRVELTINGAGHLASAFSPDGQTLATDLRDDRTTVALWDSQTAAQVGLLEAPHLDTSDGGNVLAIRFTTEGTRVLVARAYRGDVGDVVTAIDVYDSATFQRLATFEGPSGQYDTIDISSDGHVMGASFDPAVTSIWHPDEGEAPLAILEDFYGSGFLSDATLIGKPVGRPTELVEIDWTTGVQVRTIPIDLKVNWAVLSPGKDRIAVSDDVNRVAIYEVTSGATILAPTTYPSPLRLTWKPDGSELAVSGNDADVTIINPETGEELLVLSGHDTSIWSTAWDPSGDRLATIELDNQDSRIWNVGREIHTTRGNVPVEGGWGLLDPIPTGNGFLRTVPNSHVDLIDNTGVVRNRFDFDPVFPALGVVSGDGAVVGGPYGPASSALIEVASGRETPLPECASPRALSWDGSLVAIDTYRSCGEPEVPSGVIDRLTGEPVIELESDELEGATFSTKQTFAGEYVALVGVDLDSDPELFDTYVEIWSLDPLQKLITIPDTVVGHAFLLPRFSQDARYLGVGTNGSLALVVDIEAVVAGAPVDDSIVFNQEVHSSNTPRAIPNSSGLLVTSGHDGFYRFWDIETREFLMEIDVRGRIDILSHGFSPDGSTLYYMAETELISQIPTDPGEMIDLVRSSVTREFTEAECSQYLHTSGCG